MTRNAKLDAAAQAQQIAWLYFLGYHMQLQYCTKDLKVNNEILVDQIDCMLHTADYPGVYETPFTDYGEPLVHIKGLNYCCWRSENMSKYTDYALQVEKGTLDLETACKLIL